MDGSTIVLLATVPAILAIVTLAKDLGWVQGKWSALLAVVLGILFKVLDYGFATAPPQVTANGWYAAVAAGLLLGLGAAGVYDAAKTVGKSVAEANLGLYDANTVAGQVVDPPAKE